MVSAFIADTNSVRDRSPVWLTPDTSTSDSNAAHVAGALAQLADVVALRQALRGLHHADVARAGDDDDAIAARTGERRKISVVAKLAAAHRAHRGAEIGAIGFGVHELVVRAARRHARRGEHAIAQHAETADVADVDDVAGLQCIRVELRHQDDAHRLRSAEHGHDVLQREGARRRQIREIEIAIALHRLRIQLGVIAKVLVRIDVELAHQPVDVTGLRIRFAEQVVVADDDRDRQIVVEQRRPHRAVSYFTHVPLRTAGAEAHTEQRTDDERDASRDADTDPARATRWCVRNCSWLRCGRKRRPLQQQPILTFGDDDLRAT